MVSTVNVLLMEAALMLMASPLPIAPSLSVHACA